MTNKRARTTTDEANRALQVARTAAETANECSERAIELRNTSKSYLEVAVERAAAFITVEEIVDGDLAHAHETASGTIPGLYVSAIAEVKEGAWPQGIPGGYGPDLAHIGRYVEMARSEEGFAQYLQETVLGAEAAE